MTTRAKSVPRPAYGEGRQALLDAAVRVVAQSGLRGLTYRAVAAEAGVTQGLVAHHFGSRSRLVHEALLAAGDESIRDTLDTTGANIDEFASALSQFISQTEELQAFQLELVLEARRRPELKADSRALYDSYIDATGEALANMGVATNPALTRLVFAALDGLVFQQLVYGETGRTDDSLAELREIIKHLPPALGHG